MLKTLKEFHTKLLNQKTSKTTTGQIRCSGKMHKISIAHGGRITLHNHTREELTAERILAALGGELCRCSQFLKLWRTDCRTLSLSVSASKLPAWAHPALIETRQLGRNRHIAKCCSKVDIFNVLLMTRIQRRIINIIKDLAPSCTYRYNKSKSGHSSLMSCCLIVIQTSTDNLVMIQKKANRFPHIWVTVDLPYWHNQIYKKGLAVVDGVFVLTILSQNETGYTVLAGRQNEDLSIETALAYIKINTMGVKTLEFTK